MRIACIISVIATFVLCTFPAAELFANGAGIAGEPTVSRPVRAAEMPDANRVSRLMNSAVYDQQGQRLGTISDVVVSEEGAPSYAILSGPDNRLYPIPMQALERTAPRDRIVLGMTANELRNAPSFTADNWPELFETEWETRVFGYYGERVPPGAMQPSLREETPTRP